MINYVIGSFDVLRAHDLDNLDREIQMTRRDGSECFAVGVYDDKLCEILGMGTPLKKVEDRMKIMEQIRGVNFTFKITTLDKRLVKAALIKRYTEYIEEQNKRKNEPEDKEYEYGYVPGTYDLFHAGHLEHLLIADSKCKKLIVGVKADELVKEHKHTTPSITTKERMEILRHFRFVHDVYPYYTRDLNIAVDWIRSKYGDKQIAVFYGSDLKNDFKNTNIDGVEIIFTERDKELMKTRSTTAYKRVYTLKLDTEQKNKKYTSKTPITEMVGVGALNPDITQIPENESEKKEEER